MLTWKKEGELKIAAPVAFFVSSYQDRCSRKRTAVSVCASASLELLLKMSVVLINDSAPSAIRVFSSIDSSLTCAL